MTDNVQDGARKYDNAIKNYKASNVINTFEVDGVALSKLAKDKQKGDFIKVHADINGDKFSDDDLYLVVLIFLTPDSYINDPSDCGFIINNTFNTRDFIIDNKFNRMVLMDARSLHEPMVPTDNLQRLTLYAGYTISPKANPVVDRRERTLDTVGNIPGTQYYVDKSDFQYVD